MSELVSELVSAVHSAKEKQAYHSEHVLILVFVFTTFARSLSLSLSSSFVEFSSLFRSEDCLL